MEHIYRENSAEILDSYKRIHGNYEETHVHIIHSDGGDFAVVAVDVDPRESVGVASECVAYAPTRDGAQQRAQEWMGDNPKGVAGGGSGDNIGGRLVGVLKKLNDYGESLADQQQTEQQ